MIALRFQGIPTGTIREIVSDGKNVKLSMLVVGSMQMMIQAGGNMSRLGRLDADRLTLTQGCLHCRNEKIIWSNLAGFLGCPSCNPDAEVCYSCGCIVGPSELSWMFTCFNRECSGRACYYPSGYQWEVSYWGDLWQKAKPHSGQFSS